VLYYATCLVTSVKAIPYLTQNCLLADADLRVGFSDRMLGKQLPAHQKKPGRDLRKNIQTVDILKETGHEALRGMVTVPLLDTLGNVTGIYGRRIDPHAVGETETTIGSGIFNSTALSLFEGIILGHSKLDTTQIYTQVSLKKLLDTHRKTHPAEQPDLPQQSEPKSNPDSDPSTDPGTNDPGTKKP